MPSRRRRSYAGRGDAEGDRVGQARRAESRSGTCAGVISLRLAKRAGKVKPGVITSYRKQLRPRLKNGTKL